MIQHSTRVIALIEQCANANFMPKSFAQQLKLRQTPVHTTYSGLSDKSAVATTKVKFTLTNTNNTVTIKTSAYVLENIIKTCPDKQIELELETLKLANPNYHMPMEIHVLLGASIFSQIILPDLKKIKSTIAQRSAFGWLISGKTTSESNTEPHALVTTAEDKKKLQEKQMTDSADFRIQFTDNFICFCLH